MTRADNRDSTLHVVRTGPGLDTLGFSYVYWAGLGQNGISHGMPMQERLIASVLVPAQTRPQQKNQAVLDSGGGGAVLFGIFAFIALAIALAMRQSAHVLS